MRRTQAFEIKSIDESGAFEGIASVYGNVDSYGDVVEPGAFAKSIMERGKSIPVLWQHEYPIGNGEVFDAGSHLGIKGQILETVSHGSDAIKLAKAGIVKGLSIGYKTMKDQWDTANNVRRLLEVKLYEVSLVTFPANELSLVTGMKAESMEDSGIRALLFMRDEIKAGRTISAATKAKIESVIQSLSALLADDNPDGGEAAKNNNPPEPPTHSVDVASMLREFRKTL